MVIWENNKSNSLTSLIQWQLHLQNHDECKQQFWCSQLTQSPPAAVRAEVLGSSPSLAPEGVFVPWCSLWDRSHCSCTQPTEQVMGFVVPFLIIKTHFIILLIFHWPVQKCSQHYYIYSYWTSSTKGLKIAEHRPVGHQRGLFLKDMQIRVTLNNSKTSRF